MTKLKYIVFIFIAALVVTACNPAPQQGVVTGTAQKSINNNHKDDLAATDKTTQSSSVSDAVTQSYTLDQIAQHASKDNCWFAIEGKVYNVTSYIANGLHPGGEAILLGCGKDATNLYNDRPNGSGPHSAKARNSLTNFEIGTLAQ